MCNGEDTMLVLYDALTRETCINLHLFNYTVNTSERILVVQGSLSVANEGEGVEGTTHWLPGTDKREQLVPVRIGLREIRWCLLITV
jgi:hypothetical protein